MTRNDTPRSSRWGASECRSVGRAASLGRPRWRTTSLKVFCRVVAGRGVCWGRAGHSQGRGRARCQEARHHARTRGASGTQRSFRPLAWRPHTNLRGTSRAATSRGVPAGRRSPPAESIRSPSWAVGCSTKASRGRTSCRLKTTGSLWLFWGRTRAKTGHGALPRALVAPATAVEVKAKRARGDLLLLQEEEEVLAARLFADVLRSPSVVLGQRLDGFEIAPLGPGGQAPAL
jgi:hypothetical protein